MTKRVIVWCSVILGALLVALIVTVIVLIGTINKQADDEAYRACVDRLTVDATNIDQLVDAAEFCSR